MARRWRGLMWAEGWEVLGRGTPVLRQWRRAGGGGGDPDRKPSARTSQERLCRMPLGAEREAGKQLVSLHFLHLRFLALAQSPAGRVTSIGFSKSEVPGSDSATGLNVGMGEGREICPAKAQSHLELPRQSPSSFSFLHTLLGSLNKTFGWPQIRACAQRLNMAPVLWYCCTQTVRGGGIKPCPLFSYSIFIS